MSKHQLEQCVRSSLDQYFLDLNGSRPHDIYKMIVACVEKPMLEYLLERAQGNQSQAAESLGINRNTLRKSCNCTGCLNNSTMIQQALLSVSNKTGIVEFARALAARGIALLSTGGTAQYLARAGIPVTGIADYTGFPEILDGRIKTLHPKVHGALLARRDSDAHCRTLEEHGIGRIDLLAVNLYPFTQTI